MDDFRGRFIDFLEDYSSKFEKYPLMYGGSLGGIESIWHTLNAMRSFAEGLEAGSGMDCYSVIAQKYRCGNWALSGKVGQEYPDHKDQVIASSELLRRLGEVRDLQLALQRVAVLRKLQELPGKVLVLEKMDYPLSLVISEIEAESEQGELFLEMYRQIIISRARRKS